MDGGREGGREGGEKGQQLNTPVPLAQYTIVFYGEAPQCRKCCYLLRHALKLVVVQTEKLHCSQLSKTREREGLACFDGAEHDDRTSCALYSRAESDPVSTDRQTRT